MEQAVRQKFDSYPADIRPKMDYLRELVLKVAANTDGVGQIQETLKWGEPSYLTSQTKSGTTIRIDWKPKQPNQLGAYVHCSTSLIERSRTLFPELTYEGSRAILLSLDDEFPEDQLRIFFGMALRYHLDK